jgi:PAS domain S-box-containing protein
MPLSSAVDRYPLIERALRVRERPLLAYSVAMIIIAIATALRMGVGGQLIAGVPFITFYPAIIIATLFGGFGPGILSIVLSSAIAWYLFLPSPDSLAIDNEEAVSLILFVVLSAFNVFIVALLNSAIERVLAQETNMRVLIESAPNGIVVIDEQGIIRRVNASTEKLFGYPRSELLGRKVEILVPGPAAQKHGALRESYLRAPETRAMGAGRDLSGRRKDGSEFPVEIGLNPVARNGARGVLATVIDISERKRAHDRQLFFIRELQHRTANLFAVIQFIVNRSLSEAQSIPEARKELNARLEALARAHAILADAAWEGARLSEVLKRELKAFSDRLSIRGCELIINAPAAQQFAMIVHELATNAIKYGALSAPDGRIAVEGRVEQNGSNTQFLFLWKESGGPRVSNPTRRGFGSIILVDSAKQFGRHVALNYEPDGLSYELLLPVSAIAAEGYPTQNPEPASWDDEERRQAHS